MSLMIDGKKYYYFDNAATTFPKTEEVYKAIDDANRNFGVNAGRGQYTLAAKANKIIKDTTVAMEKLFHCTGNQTCVFTDSATTALNTIIQGIELHENCNVYITPFEHNAVLRTLYAKQKEKSFEIKQLSFNKESCDYNLEKIKSDFSTNKPSVIVMTHASNTFGFITPIKEIAEIAKEISSDTTVILDCAQTAGLLDIDFSTGLFDYAVFAGHKTLYGPFGIAGFICKKNSNLKTFIFGGTGIESKNKEMPIEIPGKFGAGSHNISAFAGLNAALTSINSDEVETNFCKEMETRVKLIEVLKDFSNIKIYGDNTQNAVGIVSCTFDGYSAEEIGSVLDKFNICVRTGLHCAPLGHDLMGTAPAGTVRFSISKFTTDEDLNALKEALEYIRENS